MRCALYAVSVKNKVFPPKLYIHDVVDFDTPNGGGALTELFVDGCRQTLCYEGIQMDIGNAFMNELDAYAQNPQGKVGTIWTLVGTDVNSKCLGVPTYSSLYMLSAHKIVYHTPCYTHYSENRGTTHDMMHDGDPLLNATVSYCDNCSESKAQNFWNPWPSTTTFPHSLQYMLDILYYNPIKPMPSPSSTLSPSPTLSPTPLPAKRLVYYNTGTSITAYNAADGQQVWSVGSSTSNIVGNPVLTTINYQPALLYIDTGTLHAVNPSSGSDLGITYSVTTFSLVTPPVVSNGIIYISSNDTTGPHMNGFSTSCSTSCSPLWSVPMQDGICNVPTISNNVLYITECDVYIQAFDLTQSSPTLKWTYRINGSVSTPVLADTNGILYFGWDYSPTLGWVNAVQPTYNSSNGTWSFNQLWNYQLTGAPNSLVLNNNILYFISPCWSGTPNSGSSCGTNIDALHLNDGSTVWPEVNAPVPANYNSPSSVVLANNSLYFGTKDGAHSINATSGGQNWHVLSGISGIFFTPLVAGNQIFIDSNMGLYDLNASDGSTQMQLSIVPAVSDQFQGLAVG